MKDRLMLYAVIGVFALAVGVIYMQVIQSEEDFAPIDVITRVTTDTGPLEYKYKIKVFAKNLRVPWDMALDGRGNMFVTERAGRVKRIAPDGKARTIYTVATVEVAESGLTGIALHPDFEANGHIYLYYSYREAGSVKNRVSRYIYKDETLGNEKIILDRLPGGRIHNGGRLRFGPDGKLWVLTGDSGNEALAQNRASLGGKVLRMNADGSAPDDNPTKSSLIYSYGHRNPQGLAWHPRSGELFATEHGSSAHDEVNNIKANGNYGWPIFRKCKSNRSGFRDPILCSGANTWAPSGAAFAGTKNRGLENSFFFAGLRGNLLMRLEIVDGKVQKRELIIDKKYGRLRAVAVDGDGNIYVSTSNRDGRGFPKSDDDRIFVITPVAK